MIRYAIIVGMFERYSGTSGIANNSGHNRKHESTLETRRLDSNLPHRICHGVITVVSSKSKVCLSRSLVTLPAEKTGPIRMLNRIT